MLVALHTQEKESGKKKKKSKKGGEEGGEGKKRRKRGAGEGEGEQKKQASLRACSCVLRVHGTGTPWFGLCAWDHSRKACNPQRALMKWHARGWALQQTGAHALTQVHRCTRQRSRTIAHMRLCSRRGAGQAVTLQHRSLHNANWHGCMYTLRLTFFPALSQFGSR